MFITVRSQSHLRTLGPCDPKDLRLHLVHRSHNRRYPETHSLRKVVDWLPPAVAKRPMLNAHNETSKPLSFPVVGMGASAGGLDAFEKFFERMPADCGMAFVLVQHLAPDHNSLMAELLSRVTTMPVQAVEDGTAVEPNHVYVIPPNAKLTIASGVLELAAPTELRGQRKPIDTFLQSLAEDQQHNAICVMLSGTGNDGTSGLRAIKEWGGMAMAQSRESAGYDGIPQSAIATGMVDHVLPVEEMPAQLMKYAHHLGALLENNGFEDTRAATVARLGRICLILKRRTGHDFSRYKENTIVRRVQRRMQVMRSKTLDEYLELLRKDHGEVDLLFKDLLISVTAFFRDSDAFAALVREVIPKLFAGKEADGTVRVWVAGCASGEEAYSLAMVLCEYSDTLPSPPNIKIFATDIDEKALAMARVGRYPESIEQEVSPERLERFFVKEKGSYQVKKQIRDLCLFSVHGIFRDPPFSRVDLVSCRNVLIYFDGAIQDRLIQVFHYALVPGGYLFLGTSESISGHAELFRSIDKKHRLFNRRDNLLRSPGIFPIIEPHSSRGNRPVPEEGQPPLGVGRNIAKIVERSILESYAPACVIVNEHGDAVFVSGRTARYLELPAGHPTVNIASMARKGLRPSLDAALHEASKSRQTVTKEKITLERDGQLQEINLIVRPMIELGEDSGLYMVVFQDVGPARSSARSKDGTTRSSQEQEDDSLAAHLEKELRSTREHLQFAIEELETSNEELKSTNEEYQSANEELETSKEEMQSLNEELETVNAELKKKLDEVNHLNSDLKNLIDSTEIATLFLDQDLKIRNFTPSIKKIYPLIEGDIGRPITDFAKRFKEGDLAGDIREVLRTLVPLQRELRASEGTECYSTRFLPYRTVENSINGIVITFVDITSLNRALAVTQAAQLYAERVIETGREAFLVLDLELQVKTTNRSFYDLFQTTPERTLGRKIQELGNHEWDIPELYTLLLGVLENNVSVEAFQMDVHIPLVGRKVMVLNARRIENPDGDDLILVAIEDITERRKAEETMRDAGIASLQQARAGQLRGEIGVALSGNDTLRDGLQHCAEALVKHLDAAFFRIWTLNEAEQMLVLEASAGMYTHLDGSHGRVKVGEFKIGRIAQTRQSYITNDIPSDPYVGDQEWATREGMVAFVGFPLMIAGRVLGVAAMFARHPITEGLLAELQPNCDAIAQFIQRKEAESELRQAEQRFRTAVAAVSDILWTNNEKGEMEGEQPGWAAFTGQSYEEYQGFGWSRAIHPEDAQPTIDEWNKAVAGRRRFAFEHRLQRHDGVWRLFSIRSLPVLDAAGNVEEWVGVHTDITERRQAEERLMEAEERFRNLADNIPQLAWIADAGSDGQVHWFNENWFRYTGTTLEEMRGTGWHKVHHPEHAERVIEKFTRHVQQGLDWEDTFPLRGQDGSYRWFLSRMKCIRDSSGKVVRIFGTNTDISGQQAVETQLRRANQDLESFAYSASHDLQEPLRMITSFSQMLINGLNGQLNSEAAMCVGFITDGTKRMRDLLTDLLAYTAVDAPTTGDAEQVDLNLVFEEVSKIMKVTIQESGAILTCDRLPVVSGYRAHFAQLFQNLISNAIKYRSQQPLRIQVSAEQRNGVWRLSVADNGMGIATEHHERIFGVFKRLHGKQIPGTGIGLAICQRVVERYKGRLWVESQPDKGATFYFTLQAGESKTIPS